jgi:Putative oxalocrotonate tautomerase enzyme
MPLWRIFANPNTFSLSQREGIAKAITGLYTDIGLPAFYVNVIFFDIGEDSLWIGGEQKPNFVRIAIEQIARTMPDPDTESGKAHRKGWMDMINAVSFYPFFSMLFFAFAIFPSGSSFLFDPRVHLTEADFLLFIKALKPFITDRPELEWEHHIYETPRDLWRVGGLDPPPPESEAEKSWKEKNVAHAY